MYLPPGYRIPPGGRLVGWVPENGEMPKAGGGCFGGRAACGRCGTFLPGWLDRGAVCEACGWRLYTVCEDCGGFWPRFPDHDALGGHRRVCRERSLRTALDDIQRYSGRSGFNPNIPSEGTVLIDPAADYIQIDDLDYIARKLGWEAPHKWSDGRGSGVRMVASMMPGHE